MSDIVEFLRARLDEDEAVARRAGEAYEYPTGVYANPDRINYETDPLRRFVRDGREWRMRPADMHWRRDGVEIVGVENDRQIAGDCYEYGCSPDDRSAEHIVRFDPARVLADVAAKRRIIDAFEVREEQGHADHGEVFGYHATGLLIAIRLLASVYSEHEDYRQEWTP